MFRHGKKRKKKRNYLRTWFERRCSLQQLQNLCSAVKESSSGSETELVARLLGNEKTRIFAYETPSMLVYAGYHGSRYRSSSFDESDDDPSPAEIEKKSISNAEIKEMALKQGLSSAGTRYDIVLRILQDQNQVGNPKRAAGQFDENGKFIPKKKQKSMKLPNKVTLQEKVHAKCYLVDKSKWKSRQFRRHFAEVLKLIQKIIIKEIIEKELCARGEAVFAWDICEALMLLPTWDGENRGSKGGFAMGDRISGVWRADFEIQELSKTFVKLIDATLGEGMGHDSALSLLKKQICWMLRFKQILGYERSKDFSAVCAKMTDVLSPIMSKSDELYASYQQLNQRTEEKSLFLDAPKNFVPEVNDKNPECFFCRATHGW